MFEKHVKWIKSECYYIVAFKSNARSWIAGPYPTRSQAEGVLPRAIHWAMWQSGDSDAPTYTYCVTRHYNGETRSILGEIQP